MIVSKTNDGSYSGFKMLVGFLGVFLGFIGIHAGHHGGAINVLINREVGDKVLEFIGLVLGGQAGNEQGITVLALLKKFFQLRIDFVLTFVLNRFGQIIL